VHQEIFDEAFSQVIWISYRKGFTPLTRQLIVNQDLTRSMMAKQTVRQITSDCGWGCMIRCSQMLLANTLRRLLPSKHTRDILALFLDHPEAPFSLHSMCEQGRDLMGKEPGDWYGVNSIA
jgi:cysteine protease ATG4